MSRWLTWSTTNHFQGWACSQCEWTFASPVLLTDPEAKSAYDRLAAMKFQEHDCQQHAQKTASTDVDSFAERARRLIGRGFKPKDAVELTLQDIMLEHGSDPKKIEQARIDAEQFLKRVRDGLI
jgi:hypothetical protein